MNKEKIPIFLLKFTNNATCLVYAQMAVTKLLLVVTKRNCESGAMPGQHGQGSLLARGSSVHVH